MAWRIPVAARRERCPCTARSQTAWRSGGTRSAPADGWRSDRPEMRCNGWTSVVSRERSRRSRSRSPRERLRPPSPPRGRRSRSPSELAVVVGEHDDRGERAEPRELDHRGHGRLGAADDQPLGPHLLREVEQRPDAVAVHEREARQVKRQIVRLVPPHARGRSQRRHPRHVQLPDERQCSLALLDRERRGAHVTVSRSPRRAIASPPRRRRPARRCTGPGRRRRRAGRRNGRRP